MEQPTASSHGYLRRVEGSCHHRSLERMALFISGAWTDFYMQSTATPLWRQTPPGRCFSRIRRIPVRSHQQSRHLLIAERHLSSMVTSPMSQETQCLASTFLQPTQEHGMFLHQAI